MAIHQNHNMHHTELDLGNLLLTISMAVMSHVFTVGTLQGLAAFTAIVSGGINIFYLIKRNKNK